MSGEGFLVVDFDLKKKAKSRKDDLAKLEKIKEGIVRKWKCCGNKYLKAKERRQQRMNVVVSKLEAKIESLKNEQKQILATQKQSHTAQNNEEITGVHVKTESTDNWGFSNPKSLNVLGGCGTSSPAINGVVQSTHTDNITTRTSSNCNNEAVAKEMGGARYRGLHQNKLNITPSETQYLHMMGQKADGLPEIGDVRCTPSRNNRCGAESPLKSGSLQITNKRKQNLTGQCTKKPCKGRGKMDKVRDLKESKPNKDNDNLNKESVSDEMRVKIEPTVEELVKHFVTHYHKKRMSGDGVPSNSPSENRNSIEVGSQQVKGRASRRKKSRPMKCNLQDWTEKNMDDEESQTTEPKFVSIATDVKRCPRQDQYNYRHEYKEVLSCARCRCYRRKSKWIK